MRKSKNIYLSSGYFHCKGEKNELKAYPKASFIIASLKFEWKQDVNPYSYCTERNFP